MAEWHLTFKVTFRTRFLNSKTCSRGEEGVRSWLVSPLAPHAQARFVSGSAMPPPRGRRLFVPMPLASGFHDGAE